MADIPDQIVLKRDRDLEGRAWEIWVRRGLFALLPIVALLGLLNLFGQHPSATTTNAPGAASLKLFDVAGRERIRLSVDSTNAARFEFLDEAGRVVYALPPRSR